MKIMFNANARIDGKYLNAIKFHAFCIELFLLCINVQESSINVSNYLIGSCFFDHIL